MLRRDDFFEGRRTCIVWIFLYPGVGAPYCSDIRLTISFNWTVLYLSLCNCVVMSLFEFVSPRSVFMFVRVKNKLRRKGRYCDYCRTKRSCSCLQLHVRRHQLPPSETADKSWEKQVATQTNAKVIRKKEVVIEHCKPNAGLVVS